LKRKILTSLLALTLVLGAAAAASAQVNTGSISGKVTGTDNLPLPGVSVAVSGPSIMGGVLAVTTNEQGLYRFPRVSAGTVTVEFKLAGFKDLKREGLKVDIGSKLEVNAVLEMAKLTAEVAVVAQKPVIDLERPSFNVTIDTKTLMALPMSRTASAMNAASFNAGDTFFGSTYGANWSQSNYTVDGASVQVPNSGEPFIRPSLEQTDEVEFTYGGAPAEYGNFVGSNVKVVTKAGSNTLSGSLAFNFTNSSLQSSNSDLPVSSTVPRNSVIEGSLGGAILKDRLWFFADYSNSDMHIKYPFTSTLYEYFTSVGKGKLTFALDKNNKTTISLQLGRNGNKNGQLGLNAGGTNYGPMMTASSLQDMRLTINQATFGHTAFLSEAAILDVIGGYLWSRNQNPYTRTGIPGSLNLITGTITGTVGGPTSSTESGMYRDINWSNFEGTVKLTLFNDNLAGTHEFKIGGTFGLGSEKRYMEYEGGYFEQIMGMTLGPGFTVPAYVHLTQTPYEAYQKVQTISGFVQDSWKIGGNLTLVYGLRYDDVQGLIPDQPQRNGAATIPGFTDPIVHFKQFSPRLAANYALTGDGKTMLRANWGRYYPATRTSTIAALNPAVGPVITWLAIPALGMPYSPISVTSTQAAAVDANAKNYYNDIFALSLERQITKDWAVSLHYMKKWNKNFLGLVPRQTFAPVSFVDSYNGQSMTLYKQTSTSDWYFTNVPGSYGLYSNFDSFDITVNKKFSDHWTFNFSYFYERAVGTADPAYDASQTGGGFAGFTMDPNRSINWDGPLSMNSPHQVKVFSAYEFPLGITASISLMYFRGTPWTRTAYVSPALAVTVGSVNAEPKGSRRLPDRFNIDMNLLKTFRIADAASLELYANAANLFNAGTATAYYTTTGAGAYLDSLFGTPAGFVAPRRVNLGVKILW
jgi:hypothetical protein